MLFEMADLASRITKPGAKPDVRPDAQPDTQLDAQIDVKTPTKADMTTSTAPTAAPSTVGQAAAAAASDLTDGQVDGAFDTAPPGLIESTYDVEVKLSDLQNDAQNPLFSVQSFEQLGLYDLAFFFQPRSCLRPLPRS